MNQEIDRINQVLPNTSSFEKSDAIHHWIGSVINKMDHYKSEHNQLLKENMTQLELAVWKTNLNEETSILTRDFPELQSIFQSISYSSSITSSLLQKLKSSGIRNDDDIMSFAMDFASRPEIISQILKCDFQWNTLDAHPARVGITKLVKGRMEGEANFDEKKKHKIDVDDMRKERRITSGADIIIRDVLPFLQLE